MKLLSWNLRHGHARASLEPLIDEHQPDVLLLQEAEPVVGWAGSQIGRSVRSYEWGSRVLARQGVLSSIEVPGYEGWVSGGLLEGAHESLYVFSLHAPTRKQRNSTTAYVQECLQIVGLIALLIPAHVPLVIGGDFNFKSLGERIENEQPAAERAELRALDILRSAGFTVAWRDLHPGLPLKQTLWWSGNPSTPYHADGFLVRGRPVLSCEVLERPTRRPASDHAPLTCVIGEIAAV